MRQIFEQECATRDLLLADGAKGTSLFNAGLETCCPLELWNVECPDGITTLHDRFIAARCDIILTNSFDATLFCLKLNEIENKVAEQKLVAALLVRESGVKIIGGRCGTSHEHVRAMANALFQTSPERRAMPADIKRSLVKPKNVCQTALKMGSTGAAADGGVAENDTGLC